MSSDARQRCAQLAGPTKTPHELPRPAKIRSFPGRATDKTCAHKSWSCMTLRTNLSYASPGTSSVMCTGRRNSPAFPLAACEAGEHAHSNVHMQSCEARVFKLSRRAFGMTLSSGQWQAEPLSRRVGLDMLFTTPLQESCIAKQPYYARHGEVPAGCTRRR